ncbi:MAG TPA: hypothetical protein VKH13_08465 [Steroidobacteraceae bacterium]|nr:hypothetical protein [Steroidobacteraceae bacterium]
MGIATMTARALFAENPLTQRQIHTIAGLRMLRRRSFVQVGRDIDPGLRLPQVLPHHNLVHGVAVAFAAGKIGQLPHEIRKTLTRQTWDRATGIALSLRTVAPSAIAGKLGSAPIRMRI